MNLTRKQRVILAGAVTFAGLVSLVIAYRIGATHMLQFILSHAGIAAVVSGLIGILYEGSQKGDRYEERLSALAKLMSSIHQEKLEGALLSLYPTLDNNPVLTKLHSDMRDHINLIVTMTQAIENAKGGGPLVLLRFVEKLLQFASKASETLPTGGTLKLPKSANLLAAEILSEQMGAMTEGDAYDVISDFTTWQNSELDEFRNKISSVVSGKQGLLGGLVRPKINIRRVFARFDYDGANMSQDQAKAILRKHWEIANECPEYELAVTSATFYDHVGTFKFAKGTPISFRPPQGDLSRMEVQRALYPRFDECWRDAVKVRRPQEHGNGTFVVPFEDLCEELATNDELWWTRFRTPPASDNRY